MAIAFDSSGATRVTTAATSATVDITSAAVGAFAYCLVANGANETSVTFTSWTLVNSLAGDESTATHYSLWRRQKQSGDTTFTVSWSATGAHTTIGWVSYTGLNTSTPDELAAVALHTTGASFVSPTLTPGGTGRWALNLAYARDTTSAADLPDGTTWTADAALVKRLDASNASGGSPWLSAGAFDSNGTVTVASHSYTDACHTAETHGAAFLLFLIPNIPQALAAVAVSRAAMTRTAGKLTPATPVAAGSIGRGITKHLAGTPRAAAALIHARVLILAARAAVTARLGRQTPPPVFTTGVPGLQWDTGSAATQWQVPDPPGLQWETGSPATQWQVP